MRGEKKDVWIFFLFRGTWTSFTKSFVYKSCLVFFKFMKPRSRALDRPLLRAKWGVSYSSQINVHEAETCSDWLILYYSISGYRPGFRPCCLYIYLFIYFFALRICQSIILFHKKKKKKLCCDELGIVVMAVIQVVGYKPMNKFPCLLVIVFEEKQQLTSW